MAPLTGEQVAKHNTLNDLWMIIGGNAYDLTEFAPSHPGGAKVLAKYAGKDATEEYEPLHPKGTIEKTLARDKHLGPVDMSTVKQAVVAPVQKVEGRLPRLDECLNLHDIEKAAEVLLKPKGWAYYASAADEERTKNWNHEAYQMIKFRPRVLRNVSKADLSTNFLGHPVNLPIFISPAAMGGIANKDGEKCFVRVAAAAGMPYIVSANSSIDMEELVSLVPNSLLFYQLYVNQDRAKSETVLRRAVKAGYKGICVTVDAPVPGKRERDERSQMDPDAATDSSMRAAVAPEKPGAQGIAQSLGAYVDPALDWSDLAWIRKITGGLPLMVKGIQTADDAALCAENDVQGIFLSNHGGRQLEGAPSAIETLLEIRRYQPQVFAKCQVFLDGGIRRGTDVLKALALGATAVGVGRPFMYSLVFGDEGVATVTSILRDEIKQNLRLLGATSIKELTPAMVNTRALDLLTYVEEPPLGSAPRLSKL